MYPTLETERLLLVPLQENDIEDMFNLYSDPTVAATMEHFDDIVSLETYKKNFIELVSGGECFTIQNKKTQQFMGFILSHQYIRQTKIGYSQMVVALKTEYWGKGYCTEATKELLHFAFVGIKTPWICANQFQDNPNARKVLQSCGLSFHKTYKMKNRLYDQYRYTRANYIKDKGLNANFQDNEYNYNLPKRTKSPYSFEKPIRKIDSITYIEQPTEYLCGQSVIAMLAGVSVNEVISVMQNDKGTSTQELRDVLKWYGLKTATKARLRYAEEMQLPECCILSVKLPEYGHWSLYYKGKYYDPEFGALNKLPEQAKLRYYWEVITNE